MTDNASKQAQVAADAHEAHVRVMLAVAKRIGAIVTSPIHGEYQVDLPEGWTQDRFMAEVERALLPLEVRSAFSGGLSAERIIRLAKWTK